MRIVNKLKEENILDYKIEGKNKIFFLKDNFESITKYYKFLKLLQIVKLRMIIKKITKNELIVLFESYAKNIQTKNSDIDIYIETQDEKKSSEKLSIKIGKLNKENFLSKEIIKDHVIIKNVERFYYKMNENKLKNQKKILFVKPSKIISQSYNQKADNSLKAAKILLKQNLLKESICIGYYAMYHKS
jgi:predicted nucleotidyltransferase